MIRNQIFARDVPRQRVDDNEGANDGVDGPVLHGNRAFGFVVQRRGARTDSVCSYHLL